jgi:hypothetical protein
LETAVRRLRFGVCCVIVWSSAALADQPAESSANADQRPRTAAEYAATPQANGEKPICRQETVTGSRISKTVCLTPSQRAQQQQEGRKQLQDSQVRAANTCVPGQCGG